MSVIKPLPNHTSIDTAYIVDDYPCGFTLRCKIRYWIEYKPNKGFRLCTQTTNPRKPGEVWNKPKKSTYSTIAEGLYLNDDNHVASCGLTEYSNAAESQAFKDTYYDCLCNDAKASLDRWIRAKIMYETAKTKYEADLKEAAQ